MKAARQAHMFRNSVRQWTRNTQGTKHPLEQVLELSPRISITGYSSVRKVFVTQFSDIRFVLMRMGRGLGNISSDYPSYIIYLSKGTLLEAILMFKPVPMTHIGYLVNMNRTSSNILLWQSIPHNSSCVNYHREKSTSLTMLKPPIYFVIIVSRPTIITWNSYELWVTLRLHWSSAATKSNSDRLMYPKATDKILLFCVIKCTHL